MSDVTLLEREVRRDIAAGLDAPQARWLVDYYYAVQDYRIQASGQARAVSQDADQGTVELAAHIAGNMAGIEEEIKKALGEYAKNSVPGQWALSIVGIGPVLAAGLLAHIDIAKAPTAGHIWRFAGLDPSVKWHGTKNIGELVRSAREAESTDWHAFVWICKALSYRPGHVLRAAKLIEETVHMDEATAVYDRFGGDKRLIEKISLEGDNVLLQLGDPAPAFADVYADAKLDWKAIQAFLSKRPWNGDLKVLCWKIGDSFVKQSGHENCLYGHVYRQRKEQEVERSAAGLFADQAAASLAERKIKDKDLRETYESGQLPAGRLDLRARRYAVKLFLSHLQYVMYEDRFGEPPPKPYILTQEGGHAHFIAPPNWPLQS